MSPMEPTPPRTDQTPLLTTTRTGVGWRLPALIVVLALLGLIGVARLGATEPASVAAGPSPTASAARGVPSPGSTLFIAMPGVNVPSVEPTPVARGPQALRAGTYPDGIPLEIRRSPVYRVAQAIHVGVGETILVGGWIRARADCVARRLRTCPVPVMADTDLEIVGDLSTDWIVLSQRIPGDSGPRIVRGQVQVDPRCAIKLAGKCQPRLLVDRVVWVDNWLGDHVNSQH